mgnify:FL=1
MDKPAKLKMKTANLADENFAKLAALFPNAVTETIDENGKVVRAIDADVLAQEINTHVVSGREERYQFTWPDKKKAILLANSPIAATLRPCRAESVDFDNTENLYIEGDNLDVLKLLRETYLNRIKMIYIDPPYNTGNDFIYKDDFAEDTEVFLRRDGYYDEEGNRLRTNRDSNGRFHTDWLNMMYPRLRIARDLLTEDGVVFISIDEKEVSALKIVCDEIFGQRNFIAELVWAAGRKNDSKYISVSHEYILCYFKNIQYVKDNNITWREKKQGLDAIYSKYEQLKKVYQNDYKTIENNLKQWFKSLPDGHPAKDHAHYNRVDERGIYFADNISWPGGGGPKYEILHPITKKPVKIPSRGWLTNETTMKEWIAQGRVEFGTDESSVPTLKSYLKDREYSVPYSIFYKDGRAASKRLTELMGAKVYENPKDEEIIQRLIELSCTSDNDIILDFFAGSGSTAHAVFLANLNQNIRRKFILVQIPEVIDPKKSTSEKSKRVAQNAIELLDSLGAKHNICEIGKERIRRAGKKIKEEYKDKPGIENLDIGFRVLKLDSSNVKEIYYTPDEYAWMQFKIDGFEDNIKPDRTPEDLLFQVMLDLGIPLSAKIKQEGDVFYVDDNYLIACFNRVDIDLITEIAKKKPYYAVFRDNSFESDSALINCEQIFKTYSPSTIRRVL